MSVRAYGLGEFPGTDIYQAADIITGETPDFPHLPLLPERGLGADAVGRSAAIIKHLSIDRGPRGWVLKDRPQLLSRRSWDLLEADLDACEETWGTRLKTLKTQIIGPWSLAASIEMPNGHLVLSDRGARRDVHQALVDGIAEHSAELARRFESPEVHVQLDEPLLTKVAAGRIPGTTDFDELPAIRAEHLATELRSAAEYLRHNGASSVLLNVTAQPAPWEVIFDAGVDACQLSLAQLHSHQDLDNLARALSTPGLRVGCGLDLQQVDDEQDADRQEAIKLARLIDELGLSRDVLTKEIDIHQVPASAHYSGMAAIYRRLSRIARMLHSDAGDL